MIYRQVYKPTWTRHGRSILSGFDFSKGPFWNTDAVNQSVEDCTLVFHHAASVSVPQSVEQPDKCFSINITGLANVLEAARNQGVERVMFASSSAVYGDGPVSPKHESQSPAPQSPYAASKAAGEALLHAYAASYGFDAVSLRYFNIFGPGQSADSDYAAVIVAFVTALLSDQPLHIYGDGEQTRDFAFIDNVVHANLLAGRCEHRLNGRAFNIGVGQAVSINQLAQRLIAKLDRKQVEPQHAPARAGDVMHSLADIGAAAESLAYQPIVDFDTGLSQTVDWYLSQSVSST